MSLHLCPFFVCASSEGSEETVWMCLIDWLIDRTNCGYEGLSFHILSPLGDILAPIVTASVNFMESDLRCTSRVYFDNVILTSQKPCQT